MEDLYLKRAEAFRQDPTVHYNCAQTVLLTFAKETGLDEAQAAALGTHFGGGMKTGSICGAFTGGAMVLGLLGATDAQYREFLKIMREYSNGCVDCADLLRESAKAGIDRKTNCDGLVDRAVEAVCQVMDL